MTFEDVEFGSRRSVESKPPGQPKPAPKPASKKKPAKKKRQAAKPAKSATGANQPKPKPKQRTSSTRPKPASDESKGVLVPLDQWTSILNQLGHLHQAGQQMADARERAARAETEALFLRERLRELRDELARSGPAMVEEPLDPEVVEPAVGPEPEATPDTTDRVLIVKLPRRITRWWLSRRP